MSKFHIARLPSWIESWIGPLTDSRNFQFVAYQYVVVSMILSLLLTVLVGNNPAVKVGWLIVFLHIILYVYFYISYREFSVLNERLIEGRETQPIFWFTAFILCTVILVVAMIVTQHPDIEEQFALSGVVALGVLIPMPARSFKRARLNRRKMNE